MPRLWRLPLPVVASLLISIGYIGAFYPLPFAPPPAPTVAMSRPMNATPTPLPASLAPALNAAVADANADYTVLPAPDAPGAFVARNDAHGLDLSFTSRGVRVTAGGAAAWTLRLAGMGRGEVIRAATDAIPAAENGRVVYRRGDVSEWYINGPLGLEQGFTLDAPHEGDGELVLSLALDEATPVQAGGDVTLALAGGGNLRYGGLQVTDAGGRSLPARLQAGDGTLRIVVDDRGATYPVVVDPFVRQAKLLAADRAGGDRFGYSVALSADGNTALASAYNQSTPSTLYNGAVYVFVRSGATWTQQAKLLPAPRVGGEFIGYSVALSADGATALVGAPFANSSTDSAAYVFTRSGTTWTQQARLLASDRMSNEGFGYSVALSANGSTALVGAPYKSFGFPNETGAAYVFARSGGAWSQQSELVAGDGANLDGFGYSVALSADGNTALVGANNEATAPTNGNGAAYVFVRGGTAWSGQQKLLAADRMGGTQLGTSVALSADGNTALVGAPGIIYAAYVFVRVGGTWNQQAKLSADDRAGNDSFGGAVALSADGSTALVGAPGATISTGYVGGAAYVFARNGGAWSQQDKLFATESVDNDLFGSSVALSASGDTALAGASRASDGMTAQTGAAYVFVGAAPPPTPTPLPLPARRPTVAPVASTPLPAPLPPRPPEPTATPGGAPTNTPLPAPALR